MIQIDMDMPKTCSDCRLFHEEYCSASVNELCCDVDIFNTKPDWCPLREAKHEKWIKGDEISVMNEFEKQKIEVICSHAYELCKEGKLSYEEFAKMSLEDLAKKLDSRKGRV